MRFVTLFPEAGNIHLIKDVGMIAYVLHKHFAYDSTIVCYKNEREYNYINKEVKGLRINFLRRATGNPTIDGLLYLIKNAREIDILHLFHITSSRNFYWIFIYKLLNPKGLVYLKLDANYNVKRYDFYKKGLKGYVKRKLIENCKLISVESKELQVYLKSFWNTNVELIPNGFYDNGVRTTVDFSYKENIICTVGRIGSFEKATEVLLSGFEKSSSKIVDWKLKIIGPIEVGFEEYVKKYFLENPNLKDRITFTGPISDREELENEYRKAKIFCLTSRFESFGLVFLEAMKNGCYVITSNVDSSLDITGEGKYGKIFPIDNDVQLSLYFSQICNDNMKMEQNCSIVQDFVYENFYWPAICGNIDKLLKK